MSKAIIVGLTGPARSGKDTCADYLLKLLNLRKASFAEPIKKMLEALGLTHEELYGGEIREQPHPVYGVTPRSMMQTLGTEWGRNCVHPDIWLKAMLFNVERSMTSDSFHRGVIIPDVRFENEAAFIREHGTLIHVRRDKRDAISTEGHASEQGVAFVEGDREVVNNYSLAQLYGRLESIAFDVDADHGA